MRVTRKKLCIIVPTHWSARMGGSQYQAKLLLEELVHTNRFEIYFLAARIGKNVDTANYQLIQIADRKGIRKYSFIFDAPQFFRILGKIRPDVIYQRVGCAYTGFSARYAVANDCKMVWHIAHDWDVSPEARIATKLQVLRSIEERIMEYGIRRAHNIIAQTEFQRNMLMKTYSKDAIVIPNFHPWPIEEIQKNKVIQIVWVANFKLWKRPEVFVNLARDLSHYSSVRFVMIGGSGEESGWVHSLRQEISMINNLSYLGALSQDEVNKKLAEADIFVNTSKFEGFANTFIQAWMRKVPVVSLDVCPIEELKDGEVGYCAEGSYQRLKELVSMLVENNNLRDEMGLAAQQYARTHHSIANAKRLIEIFDH